MFRRRVARGSITQFVIAAVLLPQSTRADAPAVGGVICNYYCGIGPRRFWRVSMNRAKRRSSEGVGFRQSKVGATAQCQHAPPAQGRSSGRACCAVLLSTARRRSAGGRSSASIPRAIAYGGQQRTGSVLRRTWACASAGTLGLESAGRCRPPAPAAAPPAAAAAPPAARPARPRPRPLPPPPAPPPRPAPQTQSRWQ